MATIQTLPARTTTAHFAPPWHDRRFGVAWVTLLTLLALGIHGYHPYAEDGGLYMVGVKHLLHPALYPQWSAFVTEHLRFSLFAPLIAGLVRTTHLPLMTVWLMLYIASFWIMLFAAWLLATRCYASRHARCGSVALLALWLPMPIAGTSLMLMDPYFSARSISTPCALLALVGALDLFHPHAYSRYSRIRGFALCLGALTLAAFVHPLMAAYAMGSVLVLICLIARSRQIRIGGTLSLAFLALLVATILFATAQPDSSAYREVALTRSYWFLSQWHWYEQFGLFAPLAILALIGWQRTFFGGATPRNGSIIARSLARTGVITGAVAILIALLFARTGASTYLVARLQPLRSFQLLYILMALALGAWLGEWVLRHRVVLAALCFTLIAGLMFYTERQIFPASAHFELPWSQPVNPWQQAFLWIRSHTPTDALFALDAHYVSDLGEDAQTFRAIAERSALPDFSKDGGEASITPELTPAWLLGQAAQTNLNLVPDSARIAVLKPLGVTWLVLPSASATHLPCSYDNGKVKVCRLP